MRWWLLAETACTSHDMALPNQDVVAFLPNRLVDPHAFLVPATQAAMADPAWCAFASARTAEGAAPLVDRGLALWAIQILGPDETSLWTLPRATETDLDAPSLLRRIRDGERTCGVPRDTYLPVLTLAEPGTPVKRLWPSAAAHVLLTAPGLPMLESHGPRVTATWDGSRVRASRTEVDGPYPRALGGVHTMVTEGHQVQAWPRITTALQDWPATAAFLLDEGEGCVDAHLAEATPISAITQLDRQGPPVSFVLPLPSLDPAPFEPPEPIRLGPLSMEGPWPVRWFGVQSWAHERVAGPLNPQCGEGMGCTMAGEAFGQKVYLAYDGDFVESLAVQHVGVDPAPVPVQHRWTPAHRIRARPESRPSRAAAWEDGVVQEVELALFHDGVEVARTRWSPTWQAGMRNGPQCWSSIHAEPIELRWGGPADPSSLVQGIPETKARRKFRR